MNKFQIGVLLLGAVIVIQLGTIFSKLNDIYSDVDLATQQSVQIKNSIQALPANFYNNGYR